MGDTDPCSCFAARANRGLATGFVDKEHRCGKGPSEQAGKGPGFAAEKKLVQGRDARLNQIRDWVFSPNRFYGGGGTLSFS